MVIAILRCCGGGGGDAGLAVKLIELEPGIGHLGESLEEAAELLRAHDKVIESLQSKQTPVEDLLRQADDLIADQRPKAEVYTAMAESLGQAWKDLNNHLDERKTVLTANFNFQGHFQVRRASREDCQPIHQTTAPFDTPPLLPGLSPEGGRPGEPQPTKPA